MKSPRDDELQKLIDEVVTEVENHMGSKSLVCSGNETVADVSDWISTGSSVLDKVIGKGIPVGRIVEIFGPESTGKTTLGFNVLRETQNLGGVAMMIDTEVSYDKNRAESLGLDVGKLVYAQVDTMEEVFQAVELFSDKLREKNKDCLLTILWDSVSATSTKAEIESELGASHYGIQARILSQGFRMFRRKLARRKVTFLVVSQVRHGMGMFSPKWETTGGGMALKHHASVRLELVGKQKLQSGTKVVGVQVRARTVKNKVYSPFRECQLVIDFSTGIDNVLTSFINLVQRKVIENRAGWCYYKNKKYRSKDLEKYFRDHEEELNRLVEKVDL